MVGSEPVTPSKSTQKLSVCPALMVAVSCQPEPPSLEAVGDVEPVPSQMRIACVSNALAPPTATISNTCAGTYFFHTMLKPVILRGVELALRIVKRTTPLASNPPNRKVKSPQTGVCVKVGVLGSGGGGCKLKGSGQGTDPSRLERVMDDP